VSRKKNDLELNLGTAQGAGKKNTETFNRGLEP
jgi:hypothetical protein